MDLSIALCDDEINELNFLKDLLTEWAKNSGHNIAINSFKSAEQYLFHYNDIKTSILISDIQMADMDGVNLAKRIRESNKEMQIIFVSGYTEYISDGYDVDALNYLIKPVKKEKFFSVMDKAVEKLKKSEKVIFIEGMDENIRIPLYEIKYIEVIHNNVIIHANREITARATLKSLQDMLDDRFFKTNRSFIVNLNFIHKTTRTEATLTDGTEIPISRGCYDKLNRAFINLI